jgi:hypothetical protein
VIITLAAEGVVDIAAASRLCDFAGHSVGRTFPRRGKDDLDPQLSGYNNAARLSPWLILRDLDDADCAPTLVKELLPHPSDLMLLRVAVREVESWLLADAASFADYFHVREASVPMEPDTLPQPKRAVLDLVRRSATKSIRDAMLPHRPKAKVGPGYSAKLMEFIRDHWRVEVAIKSSPSLKKCVTALTALNSR